MANTILDLKPSNVWKHFYELTQIPRPSGHMGKITAFIEDFGKKSGLETIRDSAGNVCIRKPAVPGYENRQTIILQSHLDMVPQANSDLKFDFTQDPIDAYIDGDWVKAKGTTLGADNGIGVAATMAILEATDLQHGPIEGLFTIDEETGMYGALAVRPGFINGKIMLNLDSELDGELYIGCAGGEDVSAAFQYTNETYAFGTDDVLVRIALTGLKGGHSGVDIHLGRANANQLIFRFLKEAMQTCGVRLASIQGGSLRNAIPREAFATILIEGEENYKQIVALVDSYQERFNEEFEGIENRIEWKAERQTPPAAPLKLIPANIQRKLTHAIVGCPNGVINRFAKMPDTVETSVNMAIVQSEEGAIEIKFLARSSSESKKSAICSSIESVFVNAGAQVARGNSYPGWHPNPDSEILKVMKNVFEAQRGYKPQVEVMHAGLECGIILSSVPGLDTVSFGPTIQFPHSPDEKAEIASVQKFWDYLTGILKEAPEGNEK